MMAPAVSTSGLVKRYGRVHALDGFSLDVPRGSVMGLVGPNGAGKTTWMMAVAGFLRLPAGKIDLLGDGPFDAARHSGRVSILPQDSALPLDATPFQLLRGYGRLQGLSRAAAADSAAEILKVMNLADRADSRIRTLSHGMRKRVMLAQCFIGSPELVMLDEPLNGLDPAEQERVRRFILSRRGRQTIVVSSHCLADVEVLCTHVAFIEGGRVQRMDTIRSLTEAVRRVAYALAAPPQDPPALVAALSAALPGAAFAWETPSSLSCDFSAALVDGSSPDVAAVNRAVLPALLESPGVLSVSSGQTLEQAYLHG